MSLRGGADEIAPDYSFDLNDNLQSPSSSYALPDSVFCIEAELDALKEEVRKLRQVETCHSSHTSDTAIAQWQSIDGEYDASSDSGERSASCSAALKLQRTHERVGHTHSSASRPTVHDCRPPDFESDAFPLLGEPRDLRHHNGCSQSTDGCTYLSKASYARAVKGSLAECSSRAPSPVNPPSIDDTNASRPACRGWESVHHKQCHDSSAVDTSPRRSPTKSVAFHEIGQVYSAHVERSSKQSRRAAHDVSSVNAPNFATEKRAVDRQRRKALPQEWTITSLHNPPESAPIPPRSTCMPCLDISPSRSTIRGCQRDHVHEHLGYQAQQLQQHPRVSPEPHRTVKKDSSHTSRDSPSKKTLPRSSNFASPTAASKRRSNISPRPTEPLAVKTQSKSVRASNITTSHQAAWEKTKGAKTQTTCQTKHQGREHCSEISSVVARTGELDNPKATSQSSHRLSEAILGNARSSLRKPKIGRLNISIPNDFKSDLGSPSSPSRIPRPSKGSIDSAIVHASCSITAASMTGNTSFLDSTADSELETQKPYLLRRLSSERAALLEPVVRRLSLAVSQKSRSRTSTLTDAVPLSFTATVPENDHEETLSSTVTKEDSVQPMANSDPDPTSEPPTSQPCSPKALASGGIPFISASSWLLDRIKKSALDLAEKQMLAKHPSQPMVITLTQQHPVGHAMSRSVVESSKPKAHSRNLSSISCPEDDPAILLISTSDKARRQNSRSVDVLSQISSRVRSLRATAPAFIPGIPKEDKTLGDCFMDQMHGASSETKTLAHLIDQQAPTIQLSGDATNPELSWMSREDWVSLTPDERAHIREQRRERGLSDASSAGFSNTLTYDTTSSTSHNAPHGSPMKHIASYNWVESAQKGSPIRFNRAPLPSSTNDEQAQEDMRRKGWGIGSAAPGWWYGWRGGDGLEISFVGHGPDAERHPYAPINFHDYEKSTTAQGSLIPLQGDKGPIEGNVPTAPKKMRDWATKLGYTRVPCGDVEITCATEHIGNKFNPESVDGWCHRCFPTY